VHLEIFKEITSNIEVVGGLTAATVANFGQNWINLTVIVGRIWRGWAWCWRSTVEFTIKELFFRLEIWYSNSINCQYFGQ